MTFVLQTLGMIIGCTEATRKWDETQQTN